MGNYRFRLSDMMPNSWFYKLTEMGRATRTQTIHPNSNRINHHFRTPPPPPPPSTTATTTTTTANESKSSESSALQQKQVFLPNRHSYYFPSREKTDKLSSSPSHPKGSDTHFLIHPPRETSTKTRRKAPINPSSNPPSPVSSATDIIIGFDELSVHRLRPILTKPAKKEAAENCELLDAKQVMLRKAQQRIRRMKVKASTPKVEIKKVKEYSRSQRMVNCKRLISESFVVLKKSHDPKRDFKESMVEMIIENDIRGCKDLEELLVCYLSLNSVEYHDLIVKVFQEIWVDLTEFIRL